MNNSSTNFNNNQNKENPLNNGESTHVCVIQKSSTGHSSSHSIHKKPKSDQKISINNGPSISSKAISIPKINLLKTNKSMSNMIFLSNNKTGNSNIISNNDYDSANKNNFNSNNNLIKISNYISRKKSVVNSSSKLRSVIDSQISAGVGLENKNNNNNNSFFNESYCEAISNRDKEKKTANFESINSNNNHNYLELYKDNFSSNIEIRENLILEKPQNQEDEEDEIYNQGFDNIDSSNILNENKETIDVSINNFNRVVIKEKPENSNNNNINININKEKTNEKSDINSASLKEKKNANSNKENTLNLNSRKNRTRGFNNTFAKSLSPNKLTFQQGKLVSEFNSIKEVEENKGNSPDPKASVAAKILVSFNNPTKMNLFCINKEKYFLVSFI